MCGPPAILQAMLKEAPEQARKPFTVLDATAITLLIVCLLAWLWTGLWQFGPTGAGLALAALLYSTAIDRKAITPPAA